LTSSVIRPPPPSTLFPYTTLFRSFLRLLRCFSSPGSPRYPIDSGNDPLKRGGCPIRISPDQRLLAPPRSFSQHATSFIASMRQGDRKSTRLNSSHVKTSYAVFCLK